MTIDDLAILVVDACEQEEVAYMMTGAFAFGVHAVPRGTKDIDVVIEIDEPTVISRVIGRLSHEVEFGEQVQFDTLTWGKRHIGRAREAPQLQVELFELFDDPFVLEQFKRRLKLPSPSLARELWIPTAEDVIVQKIRWARAKDLDDARDVLAVQGIESLDMDYIRHWCTAHGTLERLDGTLASLPDF